MNILMGRFFCCSVYIANIVFLHFNFYLQIYLCRLKTKKVPFIINLDSNFVGSLHHLFVLDPVSALFGLFIFSSPEPKAVADFHFLPHTRVYLVILTLANPNESPHVSYISTISQMVSFLLSLLIG